MNSDILQPANAAALPSCASRDMSGYCLTVNLVQNTVGDDPCFSASFDTDPFRRRGLLEGVDDSALTLEHEPAIAA